MKSILVLIFLLLSLSPAGADAPQSIVLVRFQGTAPPIPPAPNPDPFSGLPSNQIFNLAINTGLSFQLSWPQNDLTQNGVETGDGFFIGASANVTTFINSLSTLKFAVSAQRVTSLVSDFELQAFAFVGGKTPLDAIDDAIVTNLSEQGSLIQQGGCEQLAAGLPDVPEAKREQDLQFAAHYEALQDSIEFTNSYYATLDDGSVQRIVSDLTELCGISGGGASVGNH